MMRLKTHLKEIVNRATRAVETRASELGPSTGVASGHSYLDENLYQREKSLFASQPVPLISQSQLPDPFGFVASEGSWDKPVLVTRAQSGELRAFENRCQHRAAQVLTGS